MAGQAALPHTSFRHPLGLPAGSVRALLTFMVLGTVWTLLLMPAEKNVRVPLYLTYLMFLVIGSYFGARGAAPKIKALHETPPLYLPRGSIRLVIILGFAGVCAYGYVKDHSFFENLKFDTESIAREPYLPIVVFGAFFLGAIVSTMAGWVLAGEEGLPAWYQDLQAWVSVLAVLGLGALVIYQLVVKPTMDPEKHIELPRGLPWDTLLSSIVAFYFGARS